MKKRTGFIGLLIGFWGLAALVMFHLAVSQGYICLEGRDFSRHAAEIHIGMSKLEVQALFGESPAYACHYSESEIWYYPAPGRLTQDIAATTPAQGTLYQDRADLPDPYAHVQLAFDSNGILIAHTFIGESYTTKWRGGSVKGSHFKHLPDGAL